MLLLYSVMLLQLFRICWGERDVSNILVSILKSLGGTNITFLQKFWHLPQQDLSFFHFILISHSRKSMATDFSPITVQSCAIVLFPLAFLYFVISFFSYLHFSIFLNLFCASFPINTCILCFWFNKIL